MTPKNSVSVVVSPLVERGFVRRRRSSADGRGIVLTLTSAGRRALARAPDSAHADVRCPSQQKDADSEER